MSVLVRAAAPAAVVASEGVVVGVEEVVEEAAAEAVEEVVVVAEEEEVVVVVGVVAEGVVGVDVHSFILCLEEELAKLVGLVGWVWAWDTHGDAG